MGRVLEFFREQDPQLREVDDGTLTRYIGERHPEFLTDHTFWQEWVDVVRPPSLRPSVPAPGRMINVPENRAIAPDVNFPPPPAIAEGEAAAAAQRAQRNQEWQAEGSPRLEIGNVGELQAITMPLLNIAKPVTAEDLTTLGVPETPAKVLAGVQQGVAQTVNFFTSPLGVATLGLGALPAGAQRAVSVGFLADMASQTPEVYRGLKESIEKEDWEGAARWTTSGALNLLFSAKIARELMERPANQVAGEIGKMLLQNIRDPDLAAQLRTEVDESARSGLTPRPGELTPQEQKYLATTRPPVIEDANPLAPPAAQPRDLIVPDLMRAGRADLEDLGRQLQAARVDGNAEEMNRIRAEMTTIVRRLEGVERPRAGLEDLPGEWPSTAEQLGTFQSRGRNEARPMDTEYASARAPDISREHGTTAEQEPASGASTGVGDGEAAGQVEPAASASPAPEPAAAGEAFAPGDVRSEGTLPFSAGSRPQPRPQPRTSEERSRFQRVQQWVRRIAGDDHGIDIYWDPTERKVAPNGDRFVVESSYGADGRLRVNAAFLEDPVRIQQALREEFAHQKLATPEGQASLKRFMQEHPLDDARVRALQEEGYFPEEGETPDAYRGRLHDEFIAKQNRERFGWFREMVDRLTTWAKGKLGIDLTHEQAARAILRELRVNQRAAAAGNGQGVRQSLRPEAIEQMRKREERDAAKRIGVRNPQAKGATTRGTEQNQVSRKEMTPAALSQASKLITRYYPQVLRGKPRTLGPRERVQALVDFVADNLVWLAGQVPEQIQGRSKLWYDGARRIAEQFGRRYQVTRETAAAVIACLSPQRDWYSNVSLAERVLRIVTDPPNRGRWTPQMDDVLLQWRFRKDRPGSPPSMSDETKLWLEHSLPTLRNTPLRKLPLDLQALWVRAYSEAHLDPGYNLLSPEGKVLGPARTVAGEPAKVTWGGFSTIAKAIAVIDDPSPANISQVLGGEHKVRSFYNNVLLPGAKMGDVTIDTHAVAAGLLKPLAGTSREVSHNFGSAPKGEPYPPSDGIRGISGFYPIFADAYRLAADRTGYLPRELQSIAWEAVRGLFRPSFKRGPNIDLVDRIWGDYINGKQSLDEARQQILTAAGGIDAPSWWRGSDLGRNETGQSAPHAQELPGEGVHGSRSRVDRGRDSAAATDVPQGTPGRAGERLERHSLRSEREEEGLPVYTGRAAHAELTRIYGIPNAHPREGEIALNTQRSIFIDDASGKPVAIWEPENVRVSRPLPPTAPKDVAEGQPSRAAQQLPGEPAERAPGPASGSRPIPDEETLRNRIAYLESETERLRLASPAVRGGYAAPEANWLDLLPPDAKASAISQLRYLAGQKDLLEHWLNNPPTQADLDATWERIVKEAAQLRRPARGGDLRAIPPDTRQSTSHQLRYLDGQIDALQRFTNDPGRQSLRRERDLRFASAGAPGGTGTGAAPAPAPAPPLPRPGRGGLRAWWQQTRSQVLGLVAPQGIDSTARRVGNIIREYGAEAALKVQQADEHLAEWRRSFDRTPVPRSWTYDPARPLPRNYAFMDQSEHGGRGLRPEELKLKGEIDQMFDDLVDDVHDVAPKVLQSLIQDYFPHLWENPKAAQAAFTQILSKHPLEGGKTFLKQRTKRYFRDGLEVGLRPASDNPIDMVLLKMHEVRKFIAARQILTESKAIGARKFVYFGERPPEGWTRVDDPSSTVYAPPVVRVQEAFDAQMRAKTLELLVKLGVPHERVMRMKGKRWGEADLGAGDIRTKFAGPDFVIWHELGHQLEARYGMSRTLADTPLKKSELNAMSKARAGGAFTSPGFRRYARDLDEQMATVLQAYLHAPGLFEQIAPTVLQSFRDFVQAHPELHAINEIKPSLQMGVGKGEVPVNGMVTLGHWYMPEGAAAVLGNYISPGLGRYGLIRTLRQSSNLLNGLQLGFSAFHVGFTSLDAAVSRAAVGLQYLAEGKPIRAAWKIFSTPAAPVTNFLTGLRVQREMLRPGSQSPEIAEIARLAVVGGLRATVDPFWKTEFSRKLKRAFYEGGVRGYSKTILNAPFAMIEQIIRPIAELIVPRQKLGVFADLARFAMEQLGSHATHEQVREAMARAADSTENRMGQMTYDNLFHNRVLKELALLGFRAYGWQLGKYREAVGAAVDTAHQVGRIARLQRPELSPRMAYAIALPMVVGVAGAITQKLLAGQNPESAMDLYFPRTGKVDDNGREQRLMLPSYLKDLISDWHDFPSIVKMGTSFYHKLNPWVGLVVDMWRNKDFYGVRIYNEDDPRVRQALDLAKYALTAAKPFSVSGAQKLSEDQGAGAVDWVLPFFGIVPAKKALTLTPAEALAADLMASQMEVGSRTREEYDKSKLLKKLVQDLKADRQRGTENIVAAAQSGAIRAGDVAERIIPRLQLTPLQYQIKEIRRPADAMRVWDLASDRERAEIRQQLLLKIARSKTLQPEEQRRFVDVIVSGRALRQP